VLQGYAFCEFQDIGLTDYVIQNLNGKQIGNKFLTVKRALQPGPVAF
jgi:RNA recognition motif-containing protein